MKSAQLLAGQHEMGFAEVSAKTGQNVREVLGVWLEDMLSVHFKAAPLKDIFMTFLLSLNDNFDDDLLQEAIELLPER